MDLFFHQFLQILLHLYPKGRDAQSAFLLLFLLFEFALAIDVIVEISG